MPKISFNKGYLEQLSNLSWEIDKWEQEFALVKGELKDYDQNSGEIKLELADSNRPDLWCCEGIARQINTKLSGSRIKYDFFDQQETDKEVHVSKAMQSIRPYIATCTARNLQVTEEMLLQLIQTQEKLSENFGKKREIVSIGIYNLSKIEFPVHYKAADISKTSFTPLGFETSMSLKEIVALHPKGIQYGHLLTTDEFPILTDNNNNILSFPPIINSKSIGEVRVGDTDLFLEVTGTDMRQVMLVLNILAANMSDQGGTIEPNKIMYKYDTPIGREVTTPADLSVNMDIETSKVELSLGIKLAEGELSSYLESYGYLVKQQGRSGVSVQSPPYRDDIMSDMDIIEDFAICRGYDSFSAVMPLDYTVGSLSELEQFSDKIREYIVGFGFQEIISNILCSRASMSTDMRLDGTDLVEVDNVMTLSYGAVRSSIIPMLLQVEQSSSKAFYPHKIFEIGEVAILDESENNGSKTLSKLAVLIAHANANFSEMHSCLDLLMYYLNKEYTLRPVVNQSFISGRVGDIMINKKRVGFIGELHPEVLANWDISVPSVAFEFTVDLLLP